MFGNIYRFLTYIKGFVRKDLGWAQPLNKTLIVVILDESLSMSSRIVKVLDGFNTFISEQKRVVKDSARLTLVKFNTRVEVVHMGVPLMDVPELTTRTYIPFDETALYDAIARAVMITDWEKKADERVVCVIMTDGEENASKRGGTIEQVRDMITKREARGDWTFVYIGENPERWAKESGMSVHNTLCYDHDEPDVPLHLTSRVISSLRNSADSQSRDMFSECEENFI